jgi:hypothetical protein
MSVSQCVQTLPLTFHANELGPPMYRVSESVRSAHGQDGAIVLDIRQGQMFNLNFVGSRILELLQGGSAQPQIVDQIVREFGIDCGRAEHDVQEFLKTLKKNRLVEEQGPDNVG